MIDVSYIRILYVRTTDCNRVCQNGGTLNSELCTCNCSDNYAGDVCESEF